MDSPHSDGKETGFSQRTSDSNCLQCMTSYSRCHWRFQPGSQWPSPPISAKLNNYRVSAGSHIKQLWESQSHHVSMYKWCLRVVQTGRYTEDVVGIITSASSSSLIKTLICVSCLQGHDNDFDLLFYQGEGTAGASLWPFLLGSFFMDQEAIVWILWVPENMFPTLYSEIPQQIWCFH